MNNRQLTYALDLYKERSFSAVAEKRGITQPALSKQILHLEEELGVKLFDRTTTPITVTPAGEYFFREAQTLLYREEQLVRSMADFRTGKRGRLTIGISPFRALYLIPPVIARLRELYPEAEVVLQEQPSDVLRREAAEGRYDFAIVNLPVDESVLEVTPIESDDMVLAVPHRLCEHLPREGALSLADCGDLPFVVVGQTQELRRLFDKGCAAADIQPHIVMEVVGVSTAWSMCRAGIGATLLPRQFAEHMGAGGEVQLYPLKHSLRTRQPAVVTRRGQYVSECATAAINMLTTWGLQNCY